MKTIKHRIRKAPWGWTLDCPAPMWWRGTPFERNGIEYDTFLADSFQDAINIGIKGCGAHGKG